MEIQDFLSPTDTIVNVRAAHKAGLLQELSRQAAATLNLRADLISGDILKREDLGSTGMGNGRNWRADRLWSTLTRRDRWKP